MFGADFLIENLEVDLVASLSEAVHYGVVCCNMILGLLGIERIDKDGVGVTMVGSQDVLITNVSSYEESPSVFCVDLLYWFGPNVHFVLADG